MARLSWRSNDISRLASGNGFLAALATLVSGRTYWREADVLPVAFLNPAMRASLYVLASDCTYTSCTSRGHLSITAFTRDDACAREPPPMMTDLAASAASLERIRHLASRYSRRRCSPRAIRATSEMASALATSSSDRST